MEIKKFIIKYEIAFYTCIFITGLLISIVLPPELILKFIFHKSGVSGSANLKFQLLRYAIFLLSIFVIYLAYIVSKFSEILGVKKLFLTLFFILFIFFLTNLIVSAYFNFRHPVFTIDHLEKTLFLQSARLTKGIFPYGHSEKLPVISTIYTILYQSINAFLMKFSGISTKVPKFASFAYTILTLVLIFYYLKSLNLSWLAILYGLTTFLIVSPPFFLLWARPDSLVLFLSTLALVVFYNSKKLIHYFFAIMIMVAGYFAKQTSLCLYLSLLVYLIMTKTLRKKIIYIFLIFPLFIIMVIYFLDKISDGQFSFWTMVVANSQPPSLIGFTLKMIIKSFLLIFFPVVALPLGLISMVKDRNLSYHDFFRAKNNCLKYWVINVVIGYFLLSIFIMGKMGTTYNSYFPILGGVSILGAVLLENFLDHINGKVRSYKDNKVMTNASARILLVVFVCLVFINIICSRLTYFPMVFVEPIIDLPKWEYAEIITYLRRSSPKKVLFARGTSINKEGGFDERIGLQDLWVAVNPDDFEIWDEEQSLMNLLAAGYEIPQRIEQDLIKGNIRTIIVKKDHLPFLTRNWYYDKRNSLSKPLLFSPKIRDIFFQYYEKEKNDLRYFDVYNYGS